MQLCSNRQNDCKGKFECVKHIYECTDRKFEKVPCDAIIKLTHFFDEQESTFDQLHDHLVLHCWF